MKNITHTFSLFHKFLMLLKVAHLKIFPFDCDLSEFITENKESC